MGEEINFIDAEFQTTGNDRIDFKQILMKQIDYIRFLRVQDMGENAIFHLTLKNLGKSDRFYVWVSNAQKYQNSVNSLKSLMISYKDEKYIEEIKEIDKKYKIMLTKEIQSTKQIFQKANKKEEEFLEEVRTIKRSFALSKMNNKFDEIFEQTLLLAQRAKFIGGNDTIEEVA